MTELVPETMAATLAHDLGASEEEGQLTPYATYCPPSWRGDPTGPARVNRPRLIRQLHDLGWDVTLHTDGDVLVAEGVRTEVALSRAEKIKNAINAGRMALEDPEYAFVPTWVLMGILDDEYVGDGSEWAREMMTCPNCDCGDMRRSTEAGHDPDIQCNGCEQVFAALDLAAAAWRRRASLALSS